MPFTIGTSICPQAIALQSTGEEAEAILQGLRPVVAVMVLAADTTVPPAAPGAAGQQLVFIATQDAAGGHALAFDPAWRFPASPAFPGVTQAAGASDRLLFEYDAT